MNKQDLEKLLKDDRLNKPCQNIPEHRHRSLRFAGYIISCLAVLTSVGCANPDKIDAGQHEAAEVISKGFDFIDRLSNFGTQKPTYSTTQPSTQPANPYTP